MKKATFNIFMFLGSLLVSIPGLSQDTERPLPPVLDLITVDPATGFTTISWTPGGSPDVAGYVIYLFINEEGYAIDTIFIPAAIEYTNTKSNASRFSEAYVVAAIDSSENISPLSNSLVTIYTTTSIDTCKHELTVSWNKYISDFVNVDDYSIKFSLNGGFLVEAGINQSDDTIFIINDFQTESEYCFIIEANLQGGAVSVSNRSCIETNIPMPPDWLNANYASIISDSEIELSFTIDPDSEIERFRIERSEEVSGNYIEIFSQSGISGSWTFIDNITEYTRPLYYRLVAINNCEEPVRYSNTASLIISESSEVQSSIYLRWNSYIGWLGSVSSYEIFRNYNGQFESIGTNQPGDTIFMDDLQSIIYEVTGSEICYYVEASEGPNPYYPGAKSRSNISCLEAPVRIFVPNGFTPNEDQLNDKFRPVLSFTPGNYSLIIKNKSGLTVFETNNYLDEWDGKYRNNKLPQDVYLWFLLVETPAGKTLKRSGTVSIIFN